MKSMTFRELAEQINAMTDEQKNCDVSVYFGDIDEFFPIECRTRVANDNDEEDPAAGVLDNGHPYFVVKTY